MNLLQHLAIALVAFGAVSPALHAGDAPAKKPNILIIWGDDIGGFNISAYNHGMMGYKTPNIDRIAKEGALFTDWYGQQSCTAGRAAFITGQSRSSGSFQWFWCYSHVRFSCQAASRLLKNAAC